MMSRQAVCVCEFGNYDNNEPFVRGEWCR
jgi:hypothetical protein